MSQFNRVYTGRGLITSAAAVPSERHGCLALASFPVSQEIASFLSQTSIQMAAGRGDKTQLVAEQRQGQYHPNTLT